MTVPSVAGRRGRVLVLGISLMLLVAVCGREAWTYYEARQFNRIVEAIVARGEPTNPYQADPRPIGRPTEPNAAQHYIAASELAVTRPEWTAATRALLAAARDGDLGDDDTRRVNTTFVSQNIEPLRLVRRASSLAFHGFNTFRDYRTAPTHLLPSLLGAAALDRIGQDDGDDALHLVEDLLSTLRTAESTNRFGGRNGTAVIYQAALLVGLTVRHAPPSADALGVLASALATTERDDDLAAYFLSDRSRFVGEFWRHVRAGRPLADTSGPVAFLLEPWHRHRANRLMERFAELCAAAERPWPERLAAIAVVAGGGPEPDAWGSARGPISRERLFTTGFYSQMARWAANRAAMTAVLRAVIAVEVSRVERGTLPERLDDLSSVPRSSDPMTGGDLRYRRETGSYVVYSVGSDGKDDAGDFGELSPYSIAWQVDPDDSPDWGVRIRLPDAP